MLALPFEKIFNCFYYVVQNNLNLRVHRKNILEVNFILKYHTNYLYNQMIDISSIDYFDKKLRFELFYNLRSIKYNNRLFLVSSISENITIPSLTNLYPNAN
jgi:NADH-quinone oxidoreductase subunit C